jgi:hypothetical protein
VLRLYQPKRLIATVPPEVQKYCKIKNNQFLLPSKEEILKYKVVVTTMVTSLVLKNLELGGYFSHILIDEAAQVSLDCQFDEQQTSSIEV